MSSLSFNEMIISVSHTDFVVKPFLIWYLGEVIGLSCNVERLKWWNLKIRHSKWWHSHHYHHYHHYHYHHHHHQLSSSIIIIILNYSCLWDVTRWHTRTSSFKLRHGLCGRSRSSPWASPRLKSRGARGSPRSSGRKVRGDVLRLSPRIPVTT